MNEVREETIIGLKRQYKKAKQYVEEFFSKNPVDKEKFFECFHIRPTTSYLRIVCTADNTRLAMRTAKAVNKDDFFDLIYKSLLLINDIEKIQNLTKDEIIKNYGFNVYDIGKRREQTEYVIQAKFCQFLKKEGFNLLATEFNIKAKGRQRIDVVARKGKELWLFEIKDGDVITDSTDQVLSYKNIVEQNRQACFELLSIFDKELKEDFVVKTGVVYTKGQKSKDGIDLLLKYDKENKTFIN